MKILILFVSIVGLMLSGMAQQPQQEREKYSQIQKHTPIHKVAMTLNDPKIQKAIKLKLDSVIDEGGTDIGKLYFTYDNGTCTRIERYHTIWDEKDTALAERYKDVLTFERNEVASNVFYRWDYAKNEWTEHTKYRMTYTWGNPITGLWEGWNTNNQTWEQALKTEVVYDSNKNVIMEAYYSWWDNNWEGVEKNEYGYDNNGTLIMRIYYAWTRVKWVETYKDEYSYDNKGNQTMNAYYYWDYTNSSWIGGYKTECEYGNNRNETMRIYYSWNNSTWIESHKEESVYDQHDNRTLYVEYNWNAGQWEINNADSTTYIYSYDAENRPIQAIVMKEGDTTSIFVYEYPSSWTDRTLYMRNNGTWEEVHKYEYEYDINGNLILEANYFWNNNKWIAFYKFEFGYDNNGNKIMNASYARDNTNNKWIGLDKEEYIVDESTTVQCCLVIPNRRYEDVYFEYPFDVMIQEYRTYSWDTTENDWVYNKTSTYYYSETTVSVRELSNATGDIKVYPNPVQHNLYIDSPEKIEQISIYDINGKMLQQTFNPNQSVETGNLANGIYFVKIKTATGENVRKIIKN